MFRILILITACLIAFQGLAYGQGLLDSVLGPGGLGLWGGDQSQQSFSQQWNSPQAYGGGYGPGNPYQQQPGAAGYPPSGAGPQGYGYPAPGAAPQGYGYPAPGAAPQGYSPPPSGGMYADWQSYQPGAQGTPPPVSYSSPAPQQMPQATSQQYAPQAMPQQQPRAGVAPPGQGGPQTPLRPGQYAPRQGPMDVDSLPPGATQITTTTPDGTTVQYYPPPGEPVPPAGAVARPPRQARPRAAAGQAGKKQVTAPKASVAPTEQSTTGIAMPKPVEAPPSQDPRAGWTAR